MRVDTRYLADKNNPRPLEVVNHNIKINAQNEKLAIGGLITYHMVLGCEAWGEKINEYEYEGISYKNRRYDDPDWYYWIVINNRTIKNTYEIKCNRSGKSFIDDTVYVNRGSIWRMCNDPITFPNGKLLVCTRRQFALMDARQVKQYPVGVLWSKKKFMIPIEDFDWHNWVSSVDFI